PPADPGAAGHHGAGRRTVPRLPLAAGQRGEIRLAPPRGVVAALPAPPALLGFLRVGCGGCVHGDPPPVAEIVGRPTISASSVTPWAGGRDFPQPQRPLRRLR